MDRTRADAVAAAFALGEPVAPPSFVARGAMGELWRLDVDGGRRWAVKQLFHPVPGETNPPDVAFQLAAAGAGIRLPAPKAAPDGRFVVEGVRVYEWADLEPPLVAPADEGTVAEVGAILGTLHALAIEPAPGGVVDDWYRRTLSTDELAALADAGARADRPWAPVLRRRLGLLGELSALVAGAATSDDDVIVCHCDLAPPNVFRALGGGPLVVVDWENAGPLSAEAELAMTVASWTTPDRWRPFLDAYEAAGGPARLRGVESFATHAATVLNYLDVLARQSLEDDGHRAFAERQLDALLRDHVDTVVPRGWSP